MNVNTVTESCLEPEQPDPLYLACQQVRYPFTLEWLDGSRNTFYTPDEIYNDFWVRVMLKEILNLGHSKSG
ncbi:MAG: hypothetical protein BroJett011_33740 [Chloroflexota bacterium]|nr:MAG: hypothetical protein BroJett011_33740 [Chloroflexota bacterium]